MPLLPLFVDSRHEIRSGWKFVAYSTLLVFLFIVASIAIGGLIYLLDPGFLLLARSDIRFLGLNAIVLFIPATVAFLIMARFVDRVPLSAFGITLARAMASGSRYGCGRWRGECWRLRSWDRSFSERSRCNGTRP